MLDVTLPELEKEGFELNELLTELVAVTEAVGEGELQTVSVVVVHAAETIPLPGLEPHVEQVVQEDCPDSF